MSDYILELNNITKNFPGVKALDNANFRLKKKSIHALLGENGAGKSTLIKIITGVYNQNEGKLFLNNQEKSFSSPNEAMNAGISVVHQERNLIRRFSVGENLMLTNLPKNNLGLIDYKIVAKESKKWLDIMELDIDPNTILTSCSATNRLSNANKFFVSCGDNDEVGSSNNSIFDSKDKALAISHSCIFATVKSDTIVFGSISNSIISSHFFDSLATVL